MCLASHVMMVRPAAFGFNAETASTNEYQEKPKERVGVNDRARREFDACVSALRARGIAVWVAQDSALPPKPDAIFSNNWLSTHTDGALFLYPMAAANRRAERDPRIIAALKRDFYVDQIIDLSAYEKEGKPLESTGSMVFDRAHCHLYACLSKRTHPDSVSLFCKKSGFRSTLFHACSRRGIPYYHTNIIMAVGDAFAVVCLSSVSNPKERDTLVDTLEHRGKEIIEITSEQAEEHFAGNLLQVENNKSEKQLLLSQRAWRHFTAAQQQKLAMYGTPLAMDIPFIERVGGGSVRCMITELFLTPRTGKSDPAVGT